VLKPALQVARRWRQHDMAALAVDGWRDTRLAVAALKDKLPPIVEGEVLSVLPLKSARRDATITRLRKRGFEAWRWLRPLKQTGRQKTPQVWELRNKLLLVPLASGEKFERLADLLRDEPLESWS
jgi:hypothetical protein